MTRRRRIIPPVYYQQKRYAPRRRQNEVPNGGLLVGQPVHGNSEVDMQETPASHSVIQLSQSSQFSQPIEVAPTNQRTISDSGKNARAAQNGPQNSIQACQSLQSSQLIESDPANQRMFQDEVNMQDAPASSSHSVQIPSSTQPVAPGAVAQESLLEMIDLQRAERDKKKIAKLEKEVQNYQLTIQHIHNYIGVEDLDVEKQKEYGDMILSSGKESDNPENPEDSEDENEENNVPNVDRRKKTEMNFSFNHEYYLDVRIM